MPRTLKTHTQETYARAARIGAMLRRVRERSEMKPAEVAAKLGCATSALGMWERGDRVVPMTTFLELCDLYQIEVSMHHQITAESFEIGI